MAAAMRKTARDRGSRRAGRCRRPTGNPEWASRDDHKCLRFPAAGGNSEFHALIYSRIIRGYSCKRSRASQNGAVLPLRFATSRGLPIPAASSVRKPTRLRPVPRRRLQVRANSRLTLYSLLEVARTQEIHEISSPGYSQMVVSGGPICGSMRWYASRSTP